MKTGARHFSTAIMILLFSFALPAVTSGQTPWLSPTPEPSVSLEMLKPDLFYSDYWKVKFTSSAWYLSARYPLGDNIHGLVDMGFVLYKYEHSYAFGEETYEAPAENVFMNPYLGIELLDPNRHWYVQAGMRLPVVSEDNGGGKQYGIIADVDRMEAFGEDLIPIKLRIGDRLPQGDLTLHAYMGPSIWLFTGNRSGDDTEVWLDYGAQVWVSSEMARVGGGLIGRYLMTGEGGNFSERSLHQFGFAANFGDGIVRPGMHLRVPLDDDWEMMGVKYIWGLNLTVLIE